MTYKCPVCGALIVDPVLEDLPYAHILCSPWEDPSHRISDPDGVLAIPRAKAVKRG